MTLLRLTRILNFMKACLDRDGRLPSPRPLAQEPFQPLADRYLLGRRLLQAFHYDGIIRGVTADGIVFTPPVDASLVAQFLRGLAALTLRGVNSSSCATVRVSPFL